MTHSRMEIEQLKQPEQPSTGPNEKVQEDIQEFTKAPEVTTEFTESIGEGMRGYQGAQQFIQALKKEESKYRAQEDILAKILQEFLRTNKDPDVFDAVLALLMRNVYAGFLIATLGLIYQGLTRAVIQQSHVKPPDSPLPETHVIQESHQLTKRFESPTLRPEVKLLIDEWLSILLEIGLLYPKRLLKNLDHANNSADVIYQQLLQSLVVKFFSTHGVTISSDDIRAFSETVFQHLIQEMIRRVESKTLSKGAI